MLQAGLKLEFVYGYAGVDNTATNIFYTADGKLVYYAAAVGIVYDPTTHTQRFFQVGAVGKAVWPRNSNTMAPAATAAAACHVTQCGFLSLHLMCPMRPGDFCLPTAVSAADW